jgi:DNA-binding transcriptional LysR family regulator
VIHADQMILFARAVEEGSFSAVARTLNLTPSAVSKQVRRLEDRLGVRLLNRSTRHLSLTPEGSAIYERCREVANAVEEAEALAVAMSGEVSGALRVAATVAFGKSQLLPLVPAFLETHPRLKLDLDLSDRHLDLGAEGIDVAIRFTEQLDDASVISRKIATNRRVICAAPAYAKKHGLPQAADELVQHNCLRLSTVPSWNDWEFETANGRQVIHVNGNFEANSADAVYHAALSGLGIARLSTYLVGADLRAGRLVQVLPEYVQEHAEILAIYPDRRHLSPNVRAFIDFLVERFMPVPPWELAANGPAGMPALSVGRRVL